MWAAKRFHKKGAILLMLSYLTAITLSAMMYSMVNRQTFDVRYADIYLNRENAYYLAEAGIEQAMWWLQADLLNAINTGAPQTNFDRWQPPSGTNLGDPTIIENPGDPTTRQDAHTIGPLLSIGNGTVDIKYWNQAGIPGLFRIDSTAQVPLREGTLSKTVRAWILVPNFGRFAYFLNTDTANPSGSPVWLSTGSDFAGPVHTNSKLRIRGFPTFDARVSTSQNMVTYKNGTMPDGLTPMDPANDNPTYNGGLPVLNATSQPFPTTISRAAGYGQSVYNQAVSDGSVFLGRTIITLLPSGSIRVRTVDNATTVTIPIPAGGIVYVANHTGGTQGDVDISGTLKGRLTVVAPETTGLGIRIVNNLVYADTSATSTDMLGLVTNRPIHIARAAPANLQVYGQLLSVNDGVVVDGVLPGGPLVGNKGTLTIHGSILEGIAYPSHVTSGGLFHGYTLNLQYNPNAINGPPSFPRGAVAELSHERL